MKVQLRSIGIIAIAVAAGIVIGAGATELLVLKPLLTIDATTRYRVSLSEARLLVRQLEMLRDKEDVNLARLLESDLDAKLLNAAMYELERPSLRDNEAEKSLLRIRSYRAAYPSNMTDKLALESLQGILSTKHDSAPTP